MKKTSAKKTLGYFPIFNRRESYDHSIGGTHDIENGRCPNCRKPLMLHLSLDTRDERIGLHPSKIKIVRFLYCMRCPLSWYDFQYQMTNDTSIRVLKSYTEEVGELAEWEEEVGIEIINFMAIDLIPVTSADLAKKDVRNHIGGQPYYCQRLDDPECPGCDKPMTFRISLTNAYREKAVFTFSTVQIAFFYCQDCSIVHAQHSI